MDKEILVKLNNTMRDIGYYKLDVDDREGKEKIAKQFRDMLKIKIEEAIENNMTVVLNFEDVIFVSDEFLETVFRGLPEEVGKEDFLDAFLIETYYKSNRETFRKMYDIINDKEGVVTNE